MLTAIGAPLKIANCYKEYSILLFNCQGVQGWINRHSTDVECRFIGLVGDTCRRPAGSHLHHDRQDHRAAVRFFVEKLAQCVLDFVLDEGPVGSVAVQANE